MENSRERCQKTGLWREAHALSCLSAPWGMWQSWSNGLSSNDSGGSTGTLARWPWTDSTASNVACAGCYQVMKPKDLCGWGCSEKVFMKKHTKEVSRGWNISETDYRWVMGYGELLDSHCRRSACLRLKSTGLVSSKSLGRSATIFLSPRRIKLFQPKSFLISSEIRGIFSIGSREGTVGHVIMAWTCRCRWEALGWDSLDCLPAAGLAWGSDKPPSCHS